MFATCQCGLSDMLTGLAIDLVTSLTVDGPSASLRIANDDCPGVAFGVEECVR